MISFHEAQNKHKINLQGSSTHHKAAQNRLLICLYLKIMNFVQFYPLIYGYCAVIMIKDVNKYFPLIDFPVNLSLC